MDNFSFNRKSVKSNSNSVKPFGKNGFNTKNHFGQSNNKFAFSNSAQSKATSMFQNKNKFGTLKKENPFAKPPMSRFNNKLGNGSNLSFGNHSFNRTNNSSFPKRLGNTMLSRNSTPHRLGQSLGNSSRSSFSESQGFKGRFEQNNNDSKIAKSWHQESETPTMAHQQNRFNTRRPLNSYSTFNRRGTEPTGYEEDDNDANEYHDFNEERAPLSFHNMRRPISIEKRNYEPRSLDHIRDSHREYTPDFQQSQAYLGRNMPRELPLRGKVMADKQKLINLTNLHALALESVYEDVQDASEDLHSSRFYNIFGDCNVKTLSDHTYRISLEAAGYTKAEMKIILNPDDTLVVFGELKYPDKDKYIHIGLLPKFYKSFVLGKNSAVLGASLEHGILSIDIKEQDDDKRNTATIPIT